ncbi:MAG TPA: L-histidine N(alpha)-methyltransferase [Steroidobacteraceae bacterium]|jgi:dimethylhistidine N-methyltransferase|nr:L-histidine N(alpha)-methyltransferase [Steroidobacteraceae bacterium]
MDVAVFREDQRDAFRQDVIEGLSAPQKWLPSRWLYDPRGCELFEQITTLPEYYPTRTETAILKAHSGEIAEFCGPAAALLEYGAGAGIKTELVLAALDTPRCYLPVDIAAGFLELTAERFRERFSNLQVAPIVADFTADFSLPASVLGERRRVAFFPGSTIGNLNARDAGSLLLRMRRQVGAQGAALIGVDLKKDRAVLLPAYDDSAGVTAEFNRNILSRINRELDGQFAAAQFRHLARWNEAESAVEMHLESPTDQVIAVAGRGFAFRRGETIHTESSRKYEIKAFSELARRHGWHTQRLWTDPQRQFAVFGLI